MSDSLDDHDHFSEGDFLRLFAFSEEALRAYARVMLPNWEAVDDVLQEASVVMWRKLGQLQAETEFLPWAKVIVRFEALKFRRNRARDPHEFGDDVFELLADEADTQDEPTAARERTALRWCLSKLSPDQQELVLLPYREHGAVDQLARQMGRSANVFYKKIGRLREKLLACVEAQLAKP